MYNYDQVAFSLYIITPTFHVLFNHIIVLLLKTYLSNNVSFSTSTAGLVVVFGCLRQASAFSFSLQ